MSVVEEQIAALRRKLLDPSTRNRLLSFKHGRTNSLQFVDELMACRTLQLTVHSDTADLKDAEALLYALA